MDLYEAIEKRRTIRKFKDPATAEQLKLLPGIGPSKADAIIRYRAKRKFRATYELIRIRGIGRKTFRKLRPFLAVTGPTTLTAKVKSTPRRP